MATKGIGDLGNGIGYLYKTKLITGDIVSVERNTPQGAQAMQQMGVTNAPISAQRSAYSTITVLNSGGTGSITNIDINGVNQIGAPIVVTSTNINTVANQIVSAINSYSAPGFAFTANKPFSGFAIVYVYSAPQDGSIINGLTPSVSATDPGLQFLSNPFVNGSNDNGVVDDQFGYEFFMYADPAATPDVVPLGAFNITQFLTLRGTNTGIITKNTTLANGSILGLTRSCDTTQVIVDTGGPATANCGFIETINFVEGDTLRIRNSDPSRVTVMQDATVSTASTPNLFLANQSPFPLTGYNSITLQYRYDPVLGPIWVETGRSISNSPISITFAAFSTAASTAQLIPGARYFITDLSTGVYVYAIDAQSYEQNGVLRRYIPINYAGCWRSNMAAPTINNKYRYYQGVYKSLTGLVGTTPDTDAVNWQYDPFSTAGSYTIRYHNILLNEPALMNTWPIVQEEDANGNCVIQSYDHFQATSVNAFNSFCWNQSLLVGQDFSGNYVCDAIFDVANSDGSVSQNTVTAGVVFNNNILDASSIVSKNTFTNGSIITGNNFRSLVGNYVDGGLIQNNASGANKAPNINGNTLIKGYIIGNYSTGANAFIDSNSLYTASSILNCVFNNVGYVSLNILDTVSQIQNCVFLSAVGPSGHIAANNMSDTTVTLIQSTVGDGNSLRTCTLKSTTFVCNSNAGSQAVVDSFFDRCTFANCVEFGADKCTFTNCDVPNQIDCIFLNSTITGWTQTAAFNHLLLGTFTANVVAGVSSNKYYDLYIDLPAIFSANILTIPYEMCLGGEFRISDLSATGAITVDEIVNLPDFQKVIFYNASSGSTTPTFNKVSPGSWVVGNTIVGAANFTLNCNATGVSDYMTMAKYQGVVNMITGGVNFV